MLAQVTAAALVSENKQRAYPASVDSIPTSANQEDPRVDVGAWRAPARGHGRERRERDRDRAHCRRAGMRLPRPAQIEHPARARAGAAARTRAELDHDRYLAPDIAAAADLVRSGALAAAADMDLPGIEGPNA
jgi:histidine ammonia-lyase